MTMQTRSEYTFESLLEMQRMVSKLVAPKLTLRKRASSLVWGACCLGMGGFMVTHGFHILLTILMLGVGLFSMAHYLLFYHELAWSVSRKMKPEQRIIDFSFEKNHILARQGKVGDTYPYGDCAYLLENEKSFFYVLKSGQGMIMDKAGLKGGSVDQLRAWLEEKTGKTVRSKKK